MKATILFLFSIIFIPAILFGQWEIQSSAFNDSLRGLEQISVVDENIVWAIAYDGSGNGSVIQEFTRTTNGGMTWIPGTIANSTGYKPTGIFALNADTAWVLLYNVANDGGKVMRTNDGGLNWVHQSTALFIDSLEAYPNLIYFWNENEGFCAGDATNGYFEIYTTSNGGALWTRVASTNMPTLISGEYFYSGYFSVVGNSLWFGTSKGNIYKTNNRGNSWTSISNPFLNNGKIRVIQFKDTLNGVIGDRSGNTFSLYSTTNGGSSWQAKSPTGTVYGRSISYVPGTIGTLISTSNASTLSGSSISHDFGNTWTNIPGSSGLKFTCLSNFHNQTGWAGLLNSSNTVGGVAKYKILSQDAGVSQLVDPLNPCEGNHPITVNVTNYGQGVLDSVNINWEIDGILQTPINLISTIGAGNSLNVVLGNQNFIGNTNYNIKAYTSEPNGLNDIFNSNDTMVSTINAKSLPIVNLGKDTTILSWDSLFLDAGVGFSTYLWSTGDTSQSIYLQASIWDTLVWVEVSNSFGCINRDSILIISKLGNIENKSNKNSLKVFPNPSTGLINIELPKGTISNSLYIYNSTGTLVYNNLINNDKQVINIELANGIYFVKVSTKNQTYWSKLIIEK